MMHAFAQGRIWGRGKSLMKKQLTMDVERSLLPFEPWMNSRICHRCAKCVLGKVNQTTCTIAKRESRRGIMETLHSISVFVKLSHLKLWQELSRKLSVPSPSWSCVIYMLDMREQFIAACHVENSALRVENLVLFVLGEFHTNQESGCSENWNDC